MGRIISRVYIKGVYKPMCNMCVYVSIYVYAICVYICIQYIQLCIYVYVIYVCAMYMYHVCICVVVCVYDSTMIVV